MAGAVRIELTLTVLETAVLPLYDARKQKTRHLYMITKSAQNENNERKGLLLTFAVDRVFAAKLTILR